MSTDSAIRERARKYLAAMPPAVSDSGGHDATYAAACAMVNGFAMDEEQALDLLASDYNPNCLPPWSDAELRHKVKSAASKPHDKPRGYLLGDGRAKAPSSAPVDPEAGGLTLAKYAAVKRLPGDYLAGIGLSDCAYQGKPAIRISYGESAYRFRVRLFKGPACEERFRNPKGVALGAYSVAEILTGADVVLVEGESDVHTLAHNGIPAVGLPGAQAITESMLAAYTGAMFVVDEHDGGAKHLLGKLKAMPCADRVRVLDLTPHKDPSDLWLAVDANHDRFTVSMREAMAKAVPLHDYAPPVAPVPKAEPRIVLRSHADRMRERFAPPDMMIAGVLAVGGIGAIIALPGAGKTLAGIELARCCAAGGLFLGRQVKSGRVIYCCTDSPASTERRILAVSEDAAQSIDTVTEMPAMPGSIRDLRLLAEAARTAGDPVGMIVIDTWDSTRDHTGGGYAEQDGAIEESMRELRRLAADLALCVVLIHHCTRSENGRARGSLVFDARCDWIANAEGDGHTVTLKTTKCRDGEAGTLGTWNITTAMVNGTPMPVLTQSDAAPKPAETAPDQRMTAMVAYLASHPGKAAARTLQDKLGWKSLSHVTRAAQDARAAGYMEAADYTLTPAGFAYADSVQGYLNKTPLFSPPRTAVQVECGQPEQTQNTECSGRTATRTDPECSGPPPVCSTGEAEQGADGVGEEVMG